MITDLEARKIASEWHGGQGSALYAFSSTGAINTARADHDLFAEVRGNYHTELYGKRGANTENLSDLRSLLDYVSYREPRGPVEGWSKLTW